MPLPQPKPSFDFKTPLIILITVLAISVCIFLALKLLSINPNDTEAPNKTSETLILRAIDGDTLEMADGETIRLLCIDAPEEGKAGYEEAQDYLSSLVLAEGLRIERQGTDMYNRTLAWVYSGETLVNKEIIDLGYGDVFEYEGTNCSRVK
jgi:endonuclease YncB( thermonuclease family)